MAVSPFFTILRPFYLPHFTFHVFRPYQTPCFQSHLIDFTTNIFIDTAIASFPKRFGRNPGDDTDVSRRIRIRLRNLHEGEIRTAYDLGLLVVDECSKTMFEPKRNAHDRQPEIMEIFQNTITRIVSVHSQVLYACTLR